MLLLPIEQYLVPATTNVRSGITYGASSELTGTLIVPSPVTFRADDVVIAANHVVTLDVDATVDDAVAVPL